jgi:hypothetical protein
VNSGCSQDQFTPRNNLRLLRSVWFGTPARTRRVSRPGEQVVLVSAA